MGGCRATSWHCIRLVMAIGGSHTVTGSQSAWFAIAAARVHPTYLGRGKQDLLLV